MMSLLGGAGCDVTAGGQDVRGAEGRDGREGGGGTRSSL